MQTDRQSLQHRQVILLGASNVAIGFPLLLRLLQSGFAEPLEVFGAFGHGRSYGMWSTVLYRGLPGISACGLWDALDRHPTPPASSALLTDVGNDLLYGASVAEIGDWVESCLERLRARGADVVMTRLPMVSVRRLSPFRYNCTRTLFFPFKNLTLPVVLDLACALDDRLQALADAYGASVVEPPGAWYGFDPIHIRYRRRAAAWRSLFSNWRGFNAEAPLNRLSIAARGRVRLLRPAVRRMLGREQITPQPVWRAGQMIVSLY